MLPERKELGDGIYLIDSRFGSIIPGKAPNNNIICPEKPMVDVTNTILSTFLETQYFTPIETY